MGLQALRKRAPNGSRPPGTSKLTTLASSSYAPNREWSLRGILQYQLDISNRWQLDGDVCIIPWKTIEEACGVARLVHSILQIPDSR